MLIYLYSFERLYRVCSCTVRRLAHS